jgi:hypothetical protein
MSGSVAVCKKAPVRDTSTSGSGSSSSRNGTGSSGSGSSSSSDGSRSSSGSSSSESLGTTSSALQSCRDYCARGTKYYNGVWDARAQNCIYSSIVCLNGCDSDGISCASRTVVTSTITDIEPDLIDNNLSANIPGLDDISSLPTSATKDSDKDGLIDLIDSCPNTPLGYSVYSNGCRCKDFDNGLDYFTASYAKYASAQNDLNKGVTSLPVYNNLNGVDDSCAGKTLNEQVCDNNSDSIKSSPYVCPYDCAQGKCICPALKITKAQHTPIHPSTAQKVSFTAEVESLAGCALSSIKIYVNPPGNASLALAGSCNTSPCTIQAGPYNEGIVQYKVEVTNVTGEKTVSNYKEFTVGWPKDINCFPVYKNTAPNKGVDIVFIKYIDYAAGNAGLNAFTSDVENKVYNNFFAVEPLKTNKDKLNFYVMNISADPASVGEMNGCGWPPDEYYEYCGFANAVGVLHNASLTDCSSLGNHHFSAEGSCPAGEDCDAGSTKATLHESGHGVWGLGDEYFDDRFTCTSYTEPNPHGNAWNSNANAQAEANLQGWPLGGITQFCPPATNPNCTAHTKKVDCENDGCKWYAGKGCTDPNHCCGTGNGWYKIDPANDIMEYGLLKNTYGKACTARINHIFENLGGIDTAEDIGTAIGVLPEQEAKETGKKIVLVKLHASKGKLSERSTRIVYNLAPKKLFPEKGFRVEELSDKGAVLYSDNFSDPYLVSIEKSYKEASSAFDNFDFSWVVPFTPNANKIKITNTKTQEVLLLDLTKTVSDFCKNNPKDDYCALSEDSVSPPALPPVSGQNPLNGDSSNPLGENSGSGNSQSASQGIISNIFNFFASLFRFE